MSNNTIKDYKNAIKEKYELEIKHYSNSYLIKPSQANLRKLCWEKFENNNNQNDLNTFKTFFGFAFDLIQKNTIKTATDRFKPIGAFFRGDTESPTDDIIELAAILVDFQPRPYKLFRLKSIENEQIEKQKIDHEPSNQKNETSENIDYKIESESDSREINKPVALFLDFKKEAPQNWLKSKKSIIIGTIIIFILGFTISYCFFQKNQCMQWSEDHYEMVSCDEETLGLATFNIIEPVDKTVLNLKKIKVSDTTTFFKNGEAIVWYAKTEKGIDFFNTHGRHPENSKSLKPVTKYIIHKYVK